MNETKILAQFISELKYSDLSDEVIVKAKSLILDQLGCQLAFSQLPWSKAVYKYVKDKKCGRKESTIAYYGLRTTNEDAAFVNAAFGHGFEMDDDEPHTLTHPGVIVISSALATGEAKGISGKDFITAVVAGYDAMLRSGYAARSMIFHNFHATGVSGTLGAAAASGKIMGFKKDKMINALSIAASESSGIAEYMVSGGSVKRLHAAFASQSGVKAALLAKNGLTGPSTALEGKHGFCQAFAGECFPEEFSNNLGKEFRILWTGIKPYCCCQAQHSTIDAMKLIIDECSIKPQDVEEVLVEQMFRDVRAVGNIIEPQDMISAQFSGRFGLALRLIKGSNDYADYSEKNLKDPDLLAMAKRIKYVVNEEMSKAPVGSAPSSVTVKLKNGNIFAKRVDFGKGTIQNPMTKKEIEDKFRGLASMVLPNSRVDKIKGMIDNLEELGNIQTIMRLLIVKGEK